MSASLVSRSTVEPINLQQAKDHLRLETDDEDALVTRLITSCRLELEKWLKVAFVTQAWRVLVDVFDTPVYAPIMPVTTVVVTAIDSEGAYTDVIDAADYSADRNTGRVRPKTTISGADDFEGVQIDFTSTITALDDDLKTALLELVAYRYQNRGNIEASAIPASVKAMVQHLRYVSV